MQAAQHHKSNALNTLRNGLVAPLSDYAANLSSLSAGVQSALEIYANLLQAKVSSMSNNYQSFAPERLAQAEATAKAVEDYVMNNYSQISEELEYERKRLLYIVYGGWQSVSSAYEKLFKSQQSFAASAISSSLSRSAAAPTPPANTSWKSDLMQ